MNERPVYVWADGVHVTVRLEQARLCLLVLVGVRADGRKELITTRPECQPPGAGGARWGHAAVGEGSTIP